MRKLLALSFSAVVFCSHPTQAQSYSSNLTFQKNQYTAATIQVPFEEDVVSSAIKDFMSRKGFKDSKYKDFVVFRSVPLDSASGVFSDAYFTINRKSRSEKDLSVVSLLQVKKGQTLAPAAVEDSSFLTSTLRFLDTLKPYILSYSLNQEILAKQQTLGKINSKITDLKNDSGSIAKKIRGYENDLMENKNDQDKQTREINNISTGDQGALVKANKKMGKLLDKQTDYEKKLRNAKDDLVKNSKSLEEQRALADKESQVLDALKLRKQNIGVAMP
jgi:hypothetical protein